MFDRGTPLRLYPLPLATLNLEFTRKPPKDSLPEEIPEWFDANARTGV
jgi:hypothetical protein